MPTPCAIDISQASEGKLSETDAQQLLVNLKRMAEERSKTRGVSLDKALTQITGELKYEEEMRVKIERRNLLLNIQAKRNVKNFAKRFDTYSQGILAYLEGGNEKTTGARLSVDHIARATHGKYLGSLIAQLEEANVMEDFMRGDLDKQVYQEMGELNKRDGKPGSSKSPAAQKIAAIVEGVTSEQVSRQNMAGAFINKIAGYIVRQTHDMEAIRSLGGKGYSEDGRAKSYQIWRDFVLPLLDKEKTFRGADADKFMKMVHEGLYTGIHGPAQDDFSMSPIGVVGSLAKKASESRVLHFKDAEAAYKYNQAFGIRSIKDQVFSDLFFRSRNIALMEALGPNPELTFDNAIKELMEEARTRPDAAKQVDALRSWKLRAAFEEVTGRNDIPSNFRLSRVMGMLRAFASITRMGGSVINSLSDKVFMQFELANQGISHLNTLGAQLTGMATRTKENKRMLRMMGVAMDGLIGNTISRYTLHTSVAGFAHSIQQKFFKYNFMNYWTDANKATVAELMSAHLGEHSHMDYASLPKPVANLLDMYSITPKQWDAIRSTSWKRGDVMRDLGHATDELNDVKYITPDVLQNIPLKTMAELVTESGVTPNDTNIKRMRNSLEGKLRALFSDRIDIAVPTPGSAERKWITFGTQAGTPLGEGLRLIMLFKSFPITVLTKVLPQIHQQGGRFNTAMLIASTVVAGYLSGVVKDAIKGRTRKELMTDGKVNTDVFLDAAARGGGLGILGDFLFNQYDRNYRNVLSASAGPIIGQLDPIFAMKSRLQAGENILPDAGKMALDNTPFINLFYIRPILDYLVFWNLQEMMSPGYLSRIERAVQEKNHQDYFIRPSDVVTGQ